MRDKAKDFFYKHKFTLISAAAVAALLILWELGSIFNWFNPKFIASLSTVWNSFVDVV